MEGFRIAFQARARRARVPTVEWVRRRAQRVARLRNVYVAVVLVGAVVSFPPVVLTIAVDVVRARGSVGL